MTCLDKLKFQEVKYKNFLKNWNGQKEKDLCRYDDVCMCAIPMQVMRNYESERKQSEKLEFWLWEKNDLWLKFFNTYL